MRVRYDKPVPNIKKITITVPVLGTMAALLLALCCLHTTAGFYLPGVAPTSYREGDAVPVFVNTITPSLSQADQQLKSVISYDCISPLTTLTQTIIRVSTSASLRGALKNRAKV
jgi:hypothetical protein